LPAGIAVAGIGAAIGADVASGVAAVALVDAGSLHPASNAAVQIMAEESSFGENVMAAPCNIID